jgi:hypothetical protein
MRNAPDAWDGEQASRNTWSTRCRIPLLRCHRERRSSSKPQSPRLQRVLIRADWQPAIVPLPLRFTYTVVHSASL